MSGGKGGSQETRIPDWVRRPAERNLARAEEAGQIGYVPYYGPSVAGFSPMQQQGFANTGAMAQAFGMAPQGEMFQPTMQTQDFGNGLQAYSSGGLYDQALAELQQRRPGQFDAINGMFLDPLTGRPQQSAQPAPAASAALPVMSGGQSQGNWQDWGGATSESEFQRNNATPSAPMSYQDTYDQQMASYQRNPGISVSEVRGAPTSGGMFGGGGLLGGLF